MVRLTDAAKPDADTGYMYPATAKEAYATGSKFYFTGRPCPRGHVAPKYESTCRCVECQAEDNKARTKAQSRKYQQNQKAKDPEAFKARRAQSRRKLLKDDPIAAFAHSIRTNICRSFARKGLKKNSKTEAILGCTITEFRRHFERQFLPGMTWANRSDWHIDHIVPLATATTEDDVLALNHFTNLRPLWKADNIKKSDEITHLL